MRNLPEDIGNLKKLRILFLDKNQLIKLPKTMAHLTHLHTLDLSNNPLPDITRKILINEYLGGREPKVMIFGVKVNSGF